MVNQNEIAKDLLEALKEVSEEKRGIRKLITIKDFLAEYKRELLET